MPTGREKSQEEEQFNEELLNYRRQEQTSKKDYSYIEDGSIEKCDCGSLINSHGQCPLCDY